MPEPITPTVADQAAQAAQLSAEQQAELMAEAKKELGLCGKALRTGNRESVVSQFLVGMHGLRFINLCRKAGKARGFATDELERDLSFWLGKSVDASMVIRTYAAINLLHGDLTPPKGDRTAWTALMDSLPPLGHFHKAWTQLVERRDDGIQETWVLLTGSEDACIALYKGAVATGRKLDDSVEGGKVLEKGILTLTREFIIDYMRQKADKKAAEAAAKGEAKDKLEDAARQAEDKANEQQRVVKSLLEQSQKAKPEAKAKIEEEAKEAAKVLEDYRKEMRQLVDKATEMAREAKQAEREADDAEKFADKGTARLDKKRAEEDKGRELPWQARGEAAAEKASVKDLAEALYGIVAKHPEPEDLLYAMLKLHKKDASKGFVASLQAFGVTWERTSKVAA